MSCFASKLARISVALGLAAALAACSSSPKQVAVGSEKGCPEVAVLADTARLVKFQPGGRDVTDIVYDAEMPAAALECKVRKDEIVLDLDVFMRAQRGPAAGAEPLPVRYFVAATQNDAVVAKQTYETAIEFKKTRRSARLEGKVRKMRVPIEGKAAAKTVQILVGFELSRAELEYNRSRNRF